MIPPLYIIRHGQVQANVDDVVGGIFDTPLTSLGVSQAQQAGIFLLGLTFQKIYASPQGRVRKTLEAMRLTALPVVYDERLREIECGEVEGLPHAQLPRELHMGYMFLHQEMRRPGGESVHEVRVRVRAFMQDVLQKENAPVLILTHAAAGWALVRELLPAEGADPEELGNAEVWLFENGAAKKLFTPASTI